MNKKSYGMFYHGPTKEEKNTKPQKRPYGVHYVQPSAEEKANPGKPHGMYYRSNSPYGPNYNEVKAVQEERDALLTQSIQEVTQELHDISKKLNLLLKQAY